MKKTAVIIALALGVVLAPVNATNDLVTITNSKTIVTNAKVNAFCMSIVKGDMDTVKKLIDLGTDVNQKSNGMTPLQYAAKYNRVKIIKLLVEHGASLSVKSSKGLTAMKYAKLSNAKDAMTVLKTLGTKKKKIAKKS